MLSSLKKMRGDRKGWYKVSDLVEGVEIAVPGKNGEMIWDEIVSIKPTGSEKVYDIEVDGTHNFVGNGIFAHNTYVLRANTALAVEGVVNAESFSAPAPLASSTLMAEIPSEVLTADGKGVDLYKLATYNLAGVNALGAKVDEQGVRITALETRVDKLESGAVGVATSTPIFSTSTLASAFNAVGAYISKGFAQFGSLIADRFVAAVDSAGTSSAGTVTVLVGNTVAQVNNAYVTPATKIFVTFNSQVTGSWYVSDKQAGSFRVVLSSSQSSDVSFDYFLVQTEGQMATTTAETGESAPSVDQNGVAPVVQNSGSQTSNTNSGSLTSGTSTPPTDNATSTPPSTDTTPPVVTLVGNAAMQITVGDAFTDPGATATDDVDGDLTTHIIVSGAVDTATAGSYTLTYTATDVAGNVGSVSRLVTVLAAHVSPASADTATTTTP